MMNLFITEHRESYKNLYCTNANVHSRIQIKPTDFYFYDTGVGKTYVTAFKTANRPTRCSI